MPELDEQGEPLRCIDGYEDDSQCSGAVEYRMALSGTGESHPRCGGHWSKRLDLEDQLRVNYPDSPIPPPWFDPANAGEHWDSDY